jgi:hypothetical protein
MAGGFTFGGVVIGGSLDRVRAAMAARRATVRERDEPIAAIDSACIALMTETLTWRALDTGKLKLRQLAFGMLEPCLSSRPKPPRKPLNGRTGCRMRGNAAAGLGTDPRRACSRSWPSAGIPTGTALAS